MLKQELITFNITDAAIEELKATYADFPDVHHEDKKGEKELKNGIACIREYRVAVEKRRVELKADALEWGRKVDAEAKRITDALFKIEDPLKLKKSALEATQEKIKQEKIRAEQERIAKIKASIHEIRRIDIKASQCSLEEIKLLEEQLVANVIPVQFYQEFASEASEEKELAIARLKQIYETKHQQQVLKLEREKLAEDLRKEEAKMAEQQKILAGKEAALAEQQKQIAQEKAEKINQILPVIEQERLYIATMGKTPNPHEGADVVVYKDQYRQNPAPHPLKELKLEIGAKAYETQFQQNPEPPLIAEQNGKMSYPHVRLQAPVTITSTELTSLQDSDRTLEKFVDSLAADMAKETIASFEQELDLIVKCIEKFVASLPTVHTEKGHEIIASLHSHLISTMENVGVLK